MKQPSNNGQLVLAILSMILLFLPVLYVGSYLVVVDPGYLIVEVGDTTLHNGQPAKVMRTVPYKYGLHRIGQFYAPLEWIDRKLRPSAWKFERGAEFQVFSGLI